MFVSFYNLSHAHKFLILQNMQKHMNQRLYFVGNKAKGWISKRVFQEKARQIFQKTNML